MLVRLLFSISVCVSVGLAVGPCAPNEKLLDILKAVHKSASYNYLTAEQKVMVSELFAEAAACELTSYIQTVGYAKVLALIDHLSKEEGHFLSEYLQKHLTWEQSLGGMKPKPTTSQTSPTV